MLGLKICVSQDENANFSKVGFNRNFISRVRLNLKKLQGIYTIINRCKTFKKQNWSTYMKKCPQLLNNNKQVAEQYIWYMIPLVWNDCFCIHTTHTHTMFRETSGRRYTGSVRCGNSRKRNRGVWQVSYFHFMYFSIVWFFKELPFVTIIIFKKLHV